ncbi:MAG: hypothetical protein EXR77_08985 [Myxococcales bacterium]|nr:hypothetical protein [Myxococcales bacterium]
MSDSNSPPSPGELKAVLQVAHQRGVIDSEQSDQLLEIAKELSAPPIDHGLAQHLAAEQIRATRRDQDALELHQQLGRLRADRAKAMQWQRNARARQDPDGAQDPDDDDDAPSSDGWLQTATELDDSDQDGGGVLPLVYENIGWFVGALLVLAGSVYGLREAWTTFGPTGRWTSVASALLVYSAAFVLGSAAVAPRSQRAGQVLAAIGAGILPLVFAALANLTVIDAGLGWAAVGGATVAALTLLRLVGARFGLGQSLAFLLLPSAVGVAVMSLLGETSPQRFALPIVALALPAFAAVRIRTSVAAYGFALFGAVALEITALAASAVDTAAGAPLVWRVDGGQFAPWLGVYVGALGAVLFAAHRLQPRTSALVGPLAALAWLGAAASALAAIATGFSALTAVRPPPTTLALGLAEATAAIGIGQSLWLAVQHPAGQFLLLPLASLGAAVSCRLLAPSPEQQMLWPLAALLPQLAHLGGVKLAHGPAAADYLAVLGAAALVVMVRACEVSADGSYPTALVAAAAVAAVCHLRGMSQSTWHYAGSCVVLGGVVLATAGAANAVLLPIAVLSCAGAYTVAALVDHRQQPSTAGSPLDDVALSLFGMAAVVSWPVLRWAPRWAFADGTLALDDAALEAALPMLAAAAGLVLRSPRDVSGGPALAGALAFVAALCAVLAPPTAGATVAVLAGCALAFVTLAALLAPSAPPAAVGRLAFGAVELPWAAAELASVGRGMAVASLVCTGLALVVNLAWFGAAPADRPLAVAGGAAAAVVCALAFASGAFGSWLARGHVGWLWALGLFATAAALTNRIGRPLTPAVVALNLPIYGAILWAVSRGVALIGPRLESKLDAPVGHGRRWAHVPLTGTAALALVLVADALLLGPLPVFRGLVVVPPLMLLGPAVLALLVGRSLGARWVSATSLPLLVVGAALVAAQSSILGVSLEPLMPPGASWVPALPRVLGLDATDIARFGGPDGTMALYRQALTGSAAIGLALSVLAVGLLKWPNAAQWLVARLWPDGRASDSVKVTAGLAATAQTVVFALTVAGFWVSSAAAAALTLLIAGALLWLQRGADRPLLVAAALLNGVHAAAQLQTATPAWAGPALAVCAALVAWRGHWSLRHHSEPLPHLGHAHATAALLAIAALAYGFATGSNQLSCNPGLDLLTATVRGLDGWGNQLAPSVAVAACALPAAIAAYSYNTLAAGPAVVTALATAGGLVAATLTVATVAASGLTGAERWLATGFGFAGVAVLAHCLTLVQRQTWQDLTLAGRSLRAVALALAGAAVAGAAAVPPLQWSAFAVPLGCTTLACIAVVSGWTVWRERSGLYAWFLHSALLGSYGFLRATTLRTAPPHQDALVLFAFGFVLIGVTVWARRLQVDPIAVATRRFTAALPLVVAVVSPWQPTDDNALYAAVSAGLYAALARIERSQILGAAGAVAINLALLGLALAQGLQGLDIYLGPLGLCVLMTVQVYASAMTPQLRELLRFAGTGLTYTPAALVVMLQVGNAQNDWYPLGFALACLVGIGVGMWLRVRAYLLLGVGFLVADVGTLVVRASLRDQRLGFLVLTLTGLAVLGAMVVYTLHKARVAALVRRVRKVLGGWN